MDTTRIHRPPQSLRFMPAVALGLATVVLASLAVISLRGGGGGSDAGPDVLPPSATPSAADATPAPSLMPAAHTSPTPIAVPSPEPVDGSGGDAMPITVDLANATGADVYVDIVDRSGLLVEATSGTPGDGASVEAYTVAVENLDPTTLRLSWVDFPIDNALALYIDRFEDGFRLVLVQPEPTGPTDSMGVDRELVLTFSEPVSASQVEAFLQGGLDTPG